MMEEAIEADITELLSDPALSDVPASPSVEELDALLEAEKGSCLRLSVERGDGVEFGKMRICHEWMVAIAEVCMEACE